MILLLFSTNSLPGVLSCLLALYILRVKGTHYVYQMSLYELVSRAVLGVKMNMGMAILIYECSLL